MFKACGPSPELTHSRHHDATVAAAEAPHPFTRWINPHLGQLLQQLNLDKRYVWGRGSTLCDDQGRRYLDAIAAFGGSPFGHNPEGIWEAICSVQRRGEPNLVQPSLLEAAGELAARLVRLAPTGLQHVTLANSGAEAVEAALKMCRLATGRRKVIAASQGFHGKTLGALAVTQNPAYRDGCGADENAVFAPYGDAAGLEAALEAHSGDVAAVILEPIQGEGGIHQASLAYWSEVRRLCDRHDVLLILDEIQTGLGRTGHWFACQSLNITPDVITLAKALGGGLTPIGAVLGNHRAYTDRFGEKHSSTFAGNTIACRAALAALAMIDKNDQQLLRDVRRNGAWLKRGLQKLQRSFPDLIVDVRGEGFLLGLELSMDRNRWPESLLAVAAEQELMAPLVASYLLNVEGVRVAPTLNGKSVLRIEPALTFTKQECFQVLTALQRTMLAFRDGNTARVLGRIYGEKVRLPKTPRATTRLDIRPVAGEAKFAFLMHPMDAASFADFDPTLSGLAENSLHQVVQRTAGLLEPFVLSTARIKSATGKSIVGDFIAICRTAADLQSMPRHEALHEVRQGLQLAADRGAQLVGLGAFTSVVTRGGKSLAGRGTPVTSGNSFTAVASAEAVRLAMQQREQSLSAGCQLAIAGATGSVGRALAMLLAGDVGRLCLIGNPQGDRELVLARLRSVAVGVCRQLADEATHGRRFAFATLGWRLVNEMAKEPLDERRLGDLVDRWQALGVLRLTQDLPAVLPACDVLVTATNAVGDVVQPAWLKRQALVCDLAQPRNISRAIAAARPDVMVIDGGVIAAPGRPCLGRFGLAQGEVFACMAETMLLTLSSRCRDASLGADLQPKMLHFLREAAETHGFRIAQLKSFGQPIPTSPPAPAIVDLNDIGSVNTSLAFG